MRCTHERLFWANKLLYFIRRTLKAVCISKCILYLFNIHHYTQTLRQRLKNNIKSISRFSVSPSPSRHWKPGKTNIPCQVLYSIYASFYLFFFFRTYLLMGCLTVGWLTIFLSAAVIFRNRLMVSTSHSNVAKKAVGGKIKLREYNFDAIHLFSSGNDWAPKKSFADNQPKSVHCSNVSPDYYRLLFFDVHDSVGEFNSAIDTILLKEFLWLCLCFFFFSD